MPAPIIDGLPEYPKKSYGAKVFNLMATSWNAAIYLMTGQINTALEWINDNFLSIAESKQDTLESGENIKTINSGSLLGSGNISLQMPLVSGTNIKTINGNSILGSGNLVIAGGSGGGFDGSGEFHQVIYHEDGEGDHPFSLFTGAVRYQLSNGFCYFELGISSAGTIGTLTLDLPNDISPYNGGQYPVIFDATGEQVGRLYWPFGQKPVLHITNNTGFYNYGLCLTLTFNYINY